MNQDQMIALLKRRIKKSGSLRQFARDHGFFASVVCEIIKRKRGPDKKILALLELEKQTIYKKVTRGTR